MGKVGHRDSIETRIKKRNSGNRAQGHSEGYAEEALDLYLAGFPMAEIAEHYGVKRHGLANSIAKCALYRLLIAAKKEEFEQMSEMVNELQS